MLPFRLWGETVDKKGGVQRTGVILSLVILICVSTPVRIKPVCTLLGVIRHNYYPASVVQATP